MAQVYGVTPYGANGNTVVQNYDRSYGGGLVKLANGAAGVAPAPGDVMSFDSPSGFGHVAIVVSANVDASGNGRVRLMTQNDTVDGWRIVAVVGWQVQPFGNETPTGWLHDPLGRGQGAQAGQATPASPNGVGPTVYLRNQLTTGIADAAFSFGSIGDQVLACDWDGDGVDTPASFFRGTWSITNQNKPNAEVWNVNFGQPGDIALCGDWNGDGKDTIGFWRAGVFSLRNINTAGPADIVFRYGDPTDRPVVGDWNGDGKDTVGVYRNGMYFLRDTNSAGVADQSFGYGDPGDQPLSGDWNGDGTDTIGIWRNGALYLRNSNTTGVADYVFGYGNPGDSPIIGDWDKAGTDKLGVVRGT
jgi:hypothetical protein